MQRVEQVWVAPVSHTETGVLPQEIPAGSGMFLSNLGAFQHFNRPYEDGSLYVLVLISSVETGA
ncbi:MAG: hypothetical protein EXQ52_05935 [Bryobacterales bacterium]|nr:hypothetical protein [Bryobacterales bacterium]